MLFTKLCTLGSLAAFAAAQFPAKPEGVTVLESQLEDGVRISYKEVEGFLCVPLSFANLQ